MTKPNFLPLWMAAKATGNAAGAAVNPTPMNLVGGVPGETPKHYHEPEGMCGFAWVNVKPGTGSFARWLKKNGYGRTDSYYGGVTIWISEHGQSHERKVAHARAMAAVFTEAGFRAYADDRLD